MIARDIEEFERQKHLQSSPVQVSQYTSPIPPDQIQKYNYFVFAMQFL
jgi:hypothetical protein